MSDGEEGTAASSNQDPTGILVDVSTSKAHNDDMAERGSEQRAASPASGPEGNSLSGASSDRGVAFQPTLPRTWSSRVNPWQRPDFFQSYRDQWYCVPLIGKAILGLSVISTLLLVAWSMYYFATLHSGQDLHLAIILLIIACAYLFYVYRAIMRENVILLVVHILLSALVCCASIAWIIDSVLVPAPWRAVIAFLLLPTSACTTVLELIAMRRFGWRTYSRFAIDFRSADASLIRKLRLSASCLVTVMYLLGLTTVIMSVTGIVLFTSRDLDIKRSVAVPVLTLNTVGLVYQLAVQLAVYFCIRERSRHKYLPCLNVLFALLYSIPIVNVVLMYTSVDVSGDMTRAMIITAVATMCMLTGTWILVGLTLHYWGRLDKMDELPHPDVQDIPSVLLPLMQGAWLFRPGTVVSKRLQFFQLSADCHVLRWAWHEWVDLRYVDAVEVSDKDLKINIRLTAEPDLLLKFPDKVLYRKWKEGLKHVMCVLLGDVEMVDIADAPSVCTPSLSRRISSSTSGSWSFRRHSAWLERTGRKLSQTLQAERRKQAAKVAQLHFSVHDKKVLFDRRLHSTTLDSPNGFAAQAPALSSTLQLSTEATSAAPKAHIEAIAIPIQDNAPHNVQDAPAPHSPAATPSAFAAAVGPLLNTDDAASGVSKRPEGCVNEEGSVQREQRTRHRDKLMHQLTRLGDTHRYWGQLRVALPTLIAAASRQRSIRSSTSHISVDNGAPASIHKHYKAATPSGAAAADTDRLSEVEGLVSTGSQISMFCEESHLHSAGTAVFHGHEPGVGSGEHAGAEEDVRGMRQAATAAPLAAQDEQQLLVDMAVSQAVVVRIGAEFEDVLRQSHPFQAPAVAPGQPASAPMRSFASVVKAVMDRERATKLRRRHAEGQQTMLEPAQQPLDDDAEPAEGWWQQDNGQSAWSNEHSKIYGDVWAQLQQALHEQQAAESHCIEGQFGTGPGPPARPSDLPADHPLAPLGPPQASLQSPFQAKLPMWQTSLPQPSLPIDIEAPPTAAEQEAMAAQPMDVGVDGNTSSDFDDVFIGSPMGVPGYLQTANTAVTSSQTHFIVDMEGTIRNSLTCPPAPRLASALEQLTGRAVDLGLPLPLQEGQVVMPQELGDPDGWVQLGSGAQGQVFRAMLHGKMVAVKRFTNLDEPRNGLVMLHEIEMNLRAGRHHNVVQCLGLCSISDQELLLVLEFCPRRSFAELLQVMKNKSDHIDPAKLLTFMRSVAAGVCHLHRRGILHRDIKPGNCFIGRRQVLKLGDLGHSCHVHSCGLELLPPQPGVPEALMWGPSTVEYSAPETWHKLQLTRPIDVERVMKSDVYSFGVLLWQAATLRSPYHHFGRARRTRICALHVRKDYAELQLQRVQPPPGPQPPHVIALYEGLAVLVEDCMQELPHSRPSMTQVLKRLDELRQQLPT